MTMVASTALRLPQGAVRPDYGTCGLFGLVQSFRAFLDGEGWLDPCSGAQPHTTAAAHAPIVIFILIDGLGDAFLQRFGAGSRLLAHRRGRITSVFPSTTASAVTTIQTGIAPAAHGLTGWFIQDHRFGGILAPLPMRVRGDGPVQGLLALRRLFPYDTLFQRRRRPAALISPVEIAGSRFSRRHSRGATVHPYSGLPGMVTAIETTARALRTSGGGYIHAYYPVFDGLSHEFGCASDPVVDEFHHIDTAMGQILDRLSGTGADVIISADHGFIDSDRAHSLHLDHYPDVSAMLDSPLFGEARAAFCDVRAGAETDFEDFALAALAGKAVAVRSVDLVAHGLFGPGPMHRRLRERVGTHTLLMEPGWTIRDRVPGERDHPMLGVHGGLTPEEMWIPFIHLRC